MSKPALIKRLIIEEPCKTGRKGRTRVVLRRELYAWEDAVINLFGIATAKEQAEMYEAAATILIDYVCELMSAVSEETRGKARAELIENMHAEMRRAFGVHGEREDIS